MGFQCCVDRVLNSVTLLTKHSKKMTLMINVKPVMIEIKQTWPPEKENKLYF